MNQNYLQYFGLSEAPFSIAPNPDYLYMSPRHKEALAHLTYGFGEAGGFVMLTGEVGTGKTTVSKRLLSQLPANTQAAFILNPTLSAYELLATVCDELSIKYNDGATLKHLTDAILNHLLENHQHGRNTLLVIDEAQHLEPQVLEQLRLLTNLETHTKKLLQVILIGQPELQELLKRKDLRQLAQRITARYHLLPLSFNETQQYIEHRLTIAGSNRPIFDKSAVKLIQKISGGVPRLINVLCDRSLLGAYAEHQTHVDKRLIGAAAKEALNMDTKKFSPWQTPWAKAAMFSAFVLIPAAIGAVIGEQQLNSEKQLFAVSEQRLKAFNDEQLNQQRSHISNTLINSSRELNTAFTELYRQWHIDYVASDKNVCAAAQQFNLQCHWFNGSFDTLLALGHKSIIAFYDENGAPFYGVVDGKAKTGSDDVLNVNFAGNTVLLNKNFVARRYNQQAVLLWQPPAEYVDNLSEDVSPSLLLWSEQQLAKAQGRPVRQLNKQDALFSNQLAQFKRIKSGETLTDIETAIALSSFQYQLPTSIDAQDAANVVDDSSAQVEGE
ncbi:AAA family ATPase [Thalassotalea sp. HSM 43]|uniref:ExeA family protein n=1 Tax=Thalassotalea sp. HSM 43 TaxID=2552945 RepID=UPI00108158DD|nr:AAA family ATPase [Thalassotalea sp. HSM 43]QBY03714.1 AAA family ATPase [Thalassotalea sp. HSM 43]